MASSLLDLLRPKPFRGDVIAAGVVVLVTLVSSVVLRFHHAWDPGVHLAYVAVAWAFVTLMAVLAELEGEHPRAYQSILYVASVALLITALTELTATEDHHDAHAARDVAWIGGLVTLYALGFATRRNSAVCTLIAALAGGVAVIAAVAGLWDPAGVSTYRYVGLALVCAYGLLAIGQRDRRLRHGVALIDAAGLAVLGIGLSFIGGPFFAEDSGVANVAWGWELLILAAGFGLIAYSSVDRQPGPAYFGVLNLLTFAAITSLGVSADGATLLGWPVALALDAAALLAIGLRPST
ncbi:MAG: hypothetical protein JWR63_4041, partial [Conexibacter sp.]|nr:hypothetical protein [Conexibacter sp.]